MKKTIAFLFCLVLFISGCSSDNSSSQTTNEEYFHINVGGIQLPPLTIKNGSALNNGSIQQVGDVFLLNAFYGLATDQQHILKIYFDKSGNVINVNQHSWGVSSFAHYNYYNYENFPSNYFHINLVSLDETNKKIKLNFSGKMYLDKTNMNSESVNISGDLNMNYDINQDPYYGIVINDIEQYCSAKFNNTPWIATNENHLSAFTASDAYRIETHFAADATPDSYNFTPTSTDNYIRFSKFNTTTLTYDYYNATGTIAHSYREYHGLTKYSFIGTFSFTAVNPNNPLDVIQVTDGVFRSYQQY